MDSRIHSISTTSNNIRQEVFPLGQWTITTKKGIIMQSKCTCDRNKDLKTEQGEKLPSSGELCNICKYYLSLPQLHSLPDMLFKDNVFKLEHYSGVGIEFNPLDALRLVKETKDPLQVAVAGGWQSARSEFPFAKSALKPFDWTFTTDYRGTLLSTINKRKNNSELANTNFTEKPIENDSQLMQQAAESSRESSRVPIDELESNLDAQNEGRICLIVENTDERIDVNKLKVKEEILFYDNLTLYEDELADHGTARYSIKVRVMPKSFFILARFYLRVDGVLARINDTRIYHELNKNYLLREYTNREAKLNSLNLSVSTLIEPNELINHLPLVQSKYERLHLPKLV